MPTDDGSPAPGWGGERGTGELLLGVLTGSAIAPFLQALAGRAGDDVYAKLRDVFARRRRRPPEPREGPLALADPRARVAFRLPATVTRADMSALTEVRVPANDGRGWLLVELTGHGTGWTIRVVPGPPADAVHVDDEPG
ncbi:hypothetical protein O7635_19140 [Asanoa sp. WMMD1127]|uniref:hypothetical protein n=1 Tax=Asanoa sp. WMMD1127 TaxID=3016107 RepID=UPI00241694B9|nr:hypothetical protein [Asanoa sp. WMMD1127]MDG4823975.1 hypothetical protein [Asanoa sp. WMMD1127]